jgi:hypothetical protein
VDHATRTSRDREARPRFAYPKLSTLLVVGATIFEQAMGRHNCGLCHGIGTTSLGEYLRTIKRFGGRSMLMASIFPSPSSPLHTFSSSIGHIIFLRFQCTGIVGRGCVWDCMGRPAEYPHGSGSCSCGSCGHSLSGIVGPQG